MRRGDDPKLTPEAEQAQLEKLRREREGKASALLQAEALLTEARAILAIFGPARKARGVLLRVRLR